MIVGLAGGVGGAKLAQGLALATPASELTVVVNTADDFDLYGLRICPDLDTVLYTLAGLANPATGWGIAGDTFITLGAIARLGRDPWFRIGDQDLATHILRTERLRAGAKLTETIAELAVAFGVASKVLPMCDLAVATMVDTPAGQLTFQDYFVARRQRDEVLGVSFTGIDDAVMTREVADALDAAGLVIFCPSNPIVSIGPILAVPGMRDALRRTTVPVVAVSPIVQGKALKGPADKMLASLGHDVSAYGVARLYEGVVDAMVVDQRDADLVSSIEALGMRVMCTDTIMGDATDRARLAAEVVDFGLAVKRA
ncbi:MAG: 2-phospho-L-lactate transferase [Chloroflexota bacterium]|nr:2-phospho-L-lactate transferase [Chloroflexota bacterium]